MESPSKPQALVVIEVEKLPQQTEVIEPSEDWTGVASSKERRKLQNRLNQRAHRRRGREELLRQLQRVAENGVAGIQPSHVSQIAGTEEEGYELHASPEKRRETILFARNASMNYTLGTPRLNELQGLVALNLLNALARNARVLGFSLKSLCDDNFISPFNLEGPRLPCALRQASSWPVHLRPTEAQLKITHHPFLDLFPIPSLRDAAIRAEDLGFFDDDEFCRDIFRVDDSPSGEDWPRLIVWGEPWNPRAWEANVAFVKKWGWLIRGCPEILAGTNYWRQKRGEKKLVFSRIFGQTRVVAC
ncbi:hypothetical protein CCHL11_03732 [Colletotrichum chlorophyti]|uniref:BZIP domain-containing protein n=1 Tax=Colletotrichum chlorophyti TaxID=708187 RepID=A0A1Q8RQN8_9PEZI|nr:hypothetical protein CCHL11_03732 [Colletotrichum chlorophyti]